ncbi:hypothetical protein HIV01_010610 [Lysobacter arenosi]|uniref:Lectin n=1 Tax=Lysobacter arenosi TaxID=2795387 RepID=A0ABX7R9L7_9GAMM|nr:hypothetical protein [Lysobacter arenosi]QSX73692.1 hypothetical protein HIV01_010610 [Lysobacter arenosi]
MKWLLSLLVFGLSACGERAVDAPASSATAAPTATVAPTATAAATPEVISPVRAAMPAPGTIGFAGFGPAPFGATDEQVRMAWGSDLGDARPEQPGGCYYLLPQARSANGYRLGFMIEQDKFARMDVDAVDIEAPGGGKVGMSAQDIDRLYAGRINKQPHKYVDGGQYLRIADAGGGPGVLLFETDAKGVVSSWRIGVPPQVDYVEGCS